MTPPRLHHTHLLNGRLRVHENREDKVMRFELLPGRGIMKRFNGEWRFKADEDRPGWTSTHLHQVGH